MEDKLKQGETFFAEGKIEEAEKCFLDFLDQNPEDAESLNNLGAIHYTRGNLKEAEGYFFKALEAKEDYPDALLNLADLYQNAKRWEEAAIQLEKSIAIDDQDYNLYNQLGMIYLEIGDSQKAREVLAKSLKLNPDQEIVRQSLSVLEKKDASLKDSRKEIEKGEAFFNVAHSQQNRRAKIAVLCLPGLQSFLGDIVDYLKTKYDVRTCYSNNNQEIESAVKWADIVWLEWANELAVHVTNNMRCIGKKWVICRVHRYEVFSHFFSKIRWSIVDTTIFVAEFMSILAQKVVPGIDKKTNIRVLYNGVNLEKFKFRENAPGFNLAVVGYIHLRKNPTFWPLILSKLVEIDKRYTPHIAGEYQQVECKLYLEHIINNLGIGDNVRFYGHQDNIHSWLEDKNYLLATSIHESFGYSIAEAMAMGIKPLIHRFPGSEELWPHHCLYSSIDEVIEMIQEKDNYNSLEYYEFVEQKYSLQSQLEKIERIIEETVE